MMEAAIRAQQQQQIYSLQQSMGQLAAQNYTPGGPNLGGPTDPTTAPVHCNANVHITPDATRAHRCLPLETLDTSCERSPDPEYQHTSA